MTIEIFVEWLLHFKNSVSNIRYIETFCQALTLDKNKTAKSLNIMNMALMVILKENKHLLILDGYISHFTNEATKFGIEWTRYF